MDMQEVYKGSIRRMAENANVEINPKKALFLVVDVVNDGNSEEGFFKKVLGFDISMFQHIEGNLEKLFLVCKEASIPVVCVSSIYDFTYIHGSMRARFEAMGIKGGLAPKGAWGSRVIDRLLNLRPDFILIKSHYSPFAKLHSFMYRPGLNSELEEYMKYPAEKDEEVKRNGRKVMSDYFQEAEGTRSIKDKGVITLKNFIEDRGIDTLIVTGGSTHVCEDATVSAASELGLNIIEPIDAIASEDFDKHYVYVHNHGQFKTQLVTTEKVISTIAISVWA